MSQGTRITLAAGIGLFFVVALIQVAGEWSELNIARSKANGNKVVSALHAYKTEQGRYPDNPKQLVPKYLPMVPEPVAGTRQWRYSVSEDAAGFILEFTGSECRTCEYSEEVGWWRNDKF